MGFNMLAGLGGQPGWRELYWMDLREHLSKSIIKGGMPCRQAADRWGVAANTAIKWLQWLRHIGIG